jgi:hypothetical protein
MEEQTTTLGKKEFADYLGQAPSHVTKLIKDGRVVLTGQGRTARVKVAESLALIEQTGGSRPDVAQRHLQQRAANAKTQQSQGNHADHSEKIERGATVQTDGGSDRIGSSYQTARAVKEKYAALTAKAEYEALIGNLIPREDVDAALRFVGATVRSLMDVFPDQNAPVLCAVSDIHEVHAQLTDACREVLAQLGAAIDRQKQTIAKE